MKFYKLIDKVLLENNRLFNNNDYNNVLDFKIGPVYHGGGWNGITAPLVRDGSYGTGVYFTDKHEVAKSYATDTTWHMVQGAKSKRKGTYIVEARLKMKNPIVDDSENDWSLMVNSLVKFGWTEERANDKLNKQYERTGNVGNFFRKEAINNGYDGIIHKSKNYSIYVVFSPYDVYVTNVETL